jgi:ribosome-associated protein
MEGYQNSEWILIDYVDVVVHIFKSEIRSFYGIEELWADAKVRTFEQV